MKFRPISRRLFISEITAASILGAVGFPFSKSGVWAMGVKDFPQGIREINGNVFINGRHAKIGNTIGPEDIISTGPAPSRAIFVSGEDAYLIRENSRLKIPVNPENKKGTMAPLEIIKGKVLAVFKKARRRIITPTAVIGVRGSGLYIESDKKITYVCMCYGTFDIEAVSDPNYKESLKSAHHENARYISASGESKSLIQKAVMKNHTDHELIMLEKLVGRKPPFVKNEFKPYSGSKEGNGGY